eukprot:gnl/MRDRNA2_/MRDRNA2_123881_c0_seq1.p1 gnl/MRDRNA2_/MRDRNA2_123881_c0~~gnl/MRDRNA2_/MRDRNA2_123881_c0_seq1.p1  ORF type:complete len:389 (-),score=67.13 gnl/MRDRNA2_/MRDRNA2_123881_c0_seq1:41-1207(-)
MSDMDVDIYGDLCADLPNNLEAAPPAATATLEQSPFDIGTSEPSKSAEPKPAQSKGPILEYSSAPVDHGSWGGEWDFEGGLVVDNGQVVTEEEDPYAHRYKERPKDFDALMKELEADERPTVVRGIGSPPRDASPLIQRVGSDTEAEDSDGDDNLISCGEVRASSKPGRPQVFTPRKRNSVPDCYEIVEAAPKGTKRRETPVFFGAPPPVPSGGGTRKHLLLAGGFPWWATDAELRRHCEHFGTVRRMRLLDCPATGKSLGIALVEFTTEEGVTKAANPQEGLMSLAAWSGSGSSLRLCLVSDELFERIRAGNLPWLDGGHCSQDLRAILERQFDVVPTAPELARQRNRGREDPRLDGNFGDGAWRNKLSSLKAQINSGGSMKRLRSQ